MLGLVLTNLARRKARALATAAGIALGVATIVALLSVGAGLKRTAGDLVHLGDADLGLFQGGVADPPAPLLPVSLGRKLVQRPDVVAASPLLLLVEAIKPQPAAVVFGAGPDDFFARRLVVTAGPRFHQRHGRRRAGPADGTATGVEARREGPPVDRGRRLPHRHLLRGHRG